MVKTKEGFSDVFREAVNNSGLTLNEIVDKLKVEGLSISPASLSYWQSGRSVPRRQSSVKTLTKLEEILALPHGYLLNATPKATFSTEIEAGETFESTSRGMIVPNAFHSLPDDIDNIDWSREVQREAMRVNITISDHGRQMEATNLCIVSLRAIENPVFHVGNVWKEGESLPELLNVIGGIPGERFIHHDEHYVLREIHLPTGYATGELRQVGWTYRTYSHMPITRTPHRWFAQPLGAYSLTVQFDDIVPQTVEWVQVQTGTAHGFTQRIEAARELELDGTIARLALEDVHDCTAYVRWEW